MAASTGKLVTKAIDQYLKLYQNPEDFFSVNVTLATSLKNTTQSIYGINQSKHSVPESGCLPNLIIKNFDDEQIWQQLELRNETSVQNLLSNVARLVASEDSLGFHVREPEREEKKFKPARDDIEEDSSNKDADSDTDTELTRIKERLYAIENNADASGSDSDLNFDFDVTEGGEGEDVEVGDDVNESDMEIELPKRKKKPAYKSEVDDNFFKLADLENFLDVEDAKEVRRQRRERQGSKQDVSSDSDEDQDDVDMFENLSSSNEEEDAEESTSRNLKYADFFDPPDEKKDNTKMKEDDPNEEVTEPSKKKVSFSKDIEKRSSVKRKKQDDLLAKSDSEGEDISDIVGGKKQDNMSTYEKRQQKLKTKITAMEDASLLEKPWQLSGEIAGKARPENSLLEEHVQFEHTTRQAPVITEETTKTLEDIIRQRIKDQSWDDVERKDKRKEEAFEYKKRITLDMEQSKLSLGEIYEQEFLKQNQKREEKEVPQHEEIQKMMTSLFLKLDALCNFHYTPKQALPEVKIVSNIPSIAMEEVAPVSVSNASLLAPQEIQEKEKGDLKGKQEKTVEDRNRERRKKKSLKRSHRIEKEKREKLIDKLNPGLGNKYSKERAMKDLEKQSKVTKNVTVIKESGHKNVSSSTAFFTQLQEEVTSHIRKAKETKKDKKAARTSSTKLKL